MRNLNGREFSGRALRVDNAASEKNKEELKSKRQIKMLRSIQLRDVGAKLQLSAVSVFWRRFRNRSPHYRVSLWR